MPRQPEWLQQVPSALDQLREFPAPVLDRAALERLLSVSRRDAIRLLHRFGGYQSGRAFLIGREDLVRQLEAVAASGQYGHEVSRRSRLGEELERTRKELAGRRVRVPAATDVRDRRFRDLPDGVDLRPGELCIQFHGAEDLAAKLYALAQVMATDWEGFQKAAEPAPIGFIPIGVTPMGIDA